MRPLMDITPGEIIGSGVLPDSMNEETVVWTALDNTVLEAQGIGRPLGAQRIDTVSQTIQHIVQQTSSTEGNIAVIAGATATWKYDGTAIVPITTATFADATGTPLLETWGDWTVATNNKDKPKIRKGSGTGFVDIAGNINFTRCLQFIRRSPYLLALNTSDGPTWVKWCSDDNLEDWVITPSNTAGDFTIRDIPGAIKGGCGLGDSVLIYGQESITICTYVGPPFIFSFTTTIHGVGIFGPKAVCEVNRLNYGLGPQGAFKTDGYSYQLLGDDRFRIWLKKVLDTTKWHFVTVFHNEFTNSIEFRFPCKDGTWAALYWKLDREQFGMGNLRADAAIERDVFDTPLVAVNMALCKLTRDVATWDGVAFESKMQTKLMDCGEVGFDKFVDHVYLNGEIDNVDIQVEMQDFNREIWTALEMTDADIQNFVLAEANKVRVTLIAKDKFHISRIRLFGEVGAASI
jgi:hypothetical protein